MNTIKLTRENLHELSASPGRAGFTRKQIELLGFSWPPQKGWLTSLIGKEIDVALYEQVKGSGHKKWKNTPRTPTPIEQLAEIKEAARVLLVEIDICEKNGFEMEGSVWDSAVIALREAIKPESERLA